MNNLRLLLLEDLDEEATETISLLEAHDYEVIHVKNTKDAEKELKNRFFDIILLDIMINGQPDGISLAHRLNKEQIETPFLFLTSMQSRAVFNDAKLTKPYTYLLKPFNKLELLYSLELALEKFYEQENNSSLSDEKAIITPSFLFVKKNQGIVKVDIKSIFYVEVKEKYCRLVCDQDQEYMIRLSLTKIKELLGDTYFVQTHRNYLVNLKKIQALYFEDNLLILNNNHKILFSDRFKKQFLKNNKVFR
ncbi:LytTR family DNA-binding domain-containing protein [Tenacibaculum finnmarkense]|uniref:LytR/AlgR family response regulator transcription factor n=1 Tax=Tenacibaculum finnmarkense TaxID=2781243 RepID=UPI001E60A8B6|nr:response regulator transcription factor [Tenacibaculum finnmarkense]MCD8409198.1 response regulator transcription factor [Tenacibaculum finnmarkense genomovar ulcerans]MCD8421821.1 response regulator transcription factor [Tenacibaculum finnmarkense genomovar ulcerans]MCG8237948.1 response regulator transcription factor [Tenacibaculum finnmarkense genomovar ulcerans]MCG8732838.1 response regulator transcription factor [Tenacibaculum finnmarkense]MCG8802188.1 response regulator transcription 